MMQDTVNDTVPTAGDALLVVDVQCDFLPGGALAVPGAAAVVAPLAAWARRFAAAGRPVFATRDWHPGDHCSFVAQGGAWPPHCVAGSPGAEFAPGLDLPAGARVIAKATQRDADAYSGFAGTDLDALVKSTGRTELILAGFMTHMCVSATARAALDLKYRTTIVANATATRDLPDPLGGTIPASVVHRVALSELADRFAIVVRDTAALAAAKAA